MPIEFCPLATDWGSWGEWAAAGVAAVTGVFVYRLGSAANAIAESAQRVSDEADRREARILLIYLSGDIRNTLIKARAAQANLTGEVGATLFVGEQQVRASISRQINEMMMGTVEKRFGRLHVLSPEVGDAIAQAMGSIASLQTLGSFAQAQTHEDPTAAMANLRKMRPLFDTFVESLEVVDAACVAAASSRGPKR